MTKPIARDPIYRQRAFDADIIQLCVRWYVTYRLSYRDLVEMMAERGIKVAHSTIRTTARSSGAVRRWPDSSHSRMRPSRSQASR